MGLSARPFYLLILINLSRYAQPFELDLQRFQGWAPVEMFGNTRFPPIGEAPYVMSLAAHGFLWFRLER